MKRLRALLPLIAITLALPTLGLSCKSNVALAPIKLTYWRVFDDQSAMRDIIAAYRQIHPNVTIDYKEMRYEDYEQQFLQALAEDRGPDLFSIQNTWVGKYQPKIAPLPPTITLTFQTLQGAIQPELVTERRTVPTITPSAVRASFIDAVSKDVIRTVKRPDGNGTAEKILGLPLAADTLVLYENRDLLNNAGIATSPQNWSDFLKDVTKMTRFDDQGNIVAAGAALGTASNIPRAVDILTVLMMQNGAAMTDANGYATFQQPPPQAKNRSYRPGLEALRFYTDFASSRKEAYTWNTSMPDALTAFTQGQVGFLLGYAYQLAEIKSRGPQISLGVAPIPQADAQGNPVNATNYWVETVSKKTTHPDEAWDFIQFATSVEHVPSYLKATGKPTALRALIEGQLADPALAPFSSQLLTARTWYRGIDPGAMETALADLVQGTLVAADDQQFNTVVSNAVGKINQTIFRPAAP